MIFSRLVRKVIKTAVIGNHNFHKIFSQACQQHGAMLSKLQYSDFHFASWNELKLPLSPEQWVFTDRENFAIQYKVTKF